MGYGVFIRSGGPPSPGLPDHSQCHQLPGEEGLSVNRVLSFPHHNPDAEITEKARGED